MAEFLAKNKGFSLVELLFAMALLSVVLVGVVNLQTSTLIMTDTDANEIQAHFLANEGLEIVTAIGKSGLAAGTKYLNLAGGNYSLVDAPELPIGEFSRTLTIDSPADLSGDFRVKSEITWTDATGDHTISATRIIYE